MIPDLQAPERVPRGALDLGNDYTLLCTAEHNAHAVSHDEATTMLIFADQHDFLAGVSADWIAQPSVAKWGHLWLPNGQVAHSVWQEDCQRNPRKSCNIKVRLCFYSIPKTAILTIHCTTDTVTWTTGRFRRSSILFQDRHWGCRPCLCYGQSLQQTGRILATKLLKHHVVLSAHDHVTCH